MEPFRQTLNAFLELKRTEMKTAMKGKKGQPEDLAEPDGNETKPPLDYMTSKTLRTIKEFAVERQRKKKSGSKDVKDIAL